MMQRCNKVNFKGYNNYGGRGICVSPAWHDIGTFHEWSMQNGWAKRLTIDRKDVNGNYTPENCRWATRKQQTENVRLLSSANKSGYRGVSWTKDKKKWISRISVDYKIIHLGHFREKTDAARAYNNYVLTYGLKRPLNEVEARAAELNRHL